MSCRFFSDDEQRILLQNPYTVSVSSTSLYTTKAFKEEFLRRYLTGEKSPTQIMSELGYDPKILGYSRISGIRQHIIEAHRTGRPLRDSNYQHKISQMPYTDCLPASSKDDRGEIMRLRTEVSYLRQEVAFLKKLMKNETGRTQKKL